MYGKFAIISFLTISTIGHAKARKFIDVKEAAMSHAEALKEFKEGLDLLRNNFSRPALIHLRKAAELDNTNPFYLSYLGLTLAMVENNFVEAEDLCDAAVRKNRNQPEFYMNLAEVYRRAGKKEDAIETLTTGLRLTKRDPRLAEALQKMGMRRPPVLPFLDRKNFLNVQLGKIRTRALKSPGKNS
jgi:Flp pilus assembly protein TadD